MTDKTSSAINTSRLPILAGDDENFKLVESTTIDTGKVTVEPKLDDEKQPRVEFNVAPNTSMVAPPEKMNAAGQARELLGTMSEHDPAQIRITLATYRRRWIILAVVALLNNSNTMSWIAFAPIANFVDEFYHKEGAANWFSMIYLMCSIPVGLIAMWAGRVFGLRTAILIAGTTNAIGATIRFTSSFLSAELRFPVGICGQAIASIAYPFIMFLPTKVAGAWFPDNQRALATTIGVMANPLGVLLANLISPQLVLSIDHVVYLNALTFGPAVVTCLLALATVTRSEPAIPPTLSASTKQTSFFSGVKKCLTSRTYLLLCLVMGGGIGMFNTLYTIMQQLLCPHGYTNSFSGFCCVLMIVGGVFGATSAGIFVDRTKMYEETMKVAMALAVVFGLLFVQLSLHANLHIFIAISCLAFGILGLATYPVGLDLASECSFPVSETTSTGFIVLCGQIQSVIFLTIMSVLSRPLSDADQQYQVCQVPGVSDSRAVVPKDMTISVLVFSAIAALLVILLIVFFRPKYRRLRAEQGVTNVSTVKPVDDAQLEEQANVENGSDEMASYSPRQSI